MVEEIREATKRLSRKLREERLVSFFPNSNRYGPLPIPGRRFGGTSGAAGDTLLSNRRSFSNVGLSATDS